jgi:hypothetical protein
MRRAWLDEGSQRSSCALALRLRKSHFPLRAFYWNFVVTNLDDSPAYSQACFQAAFDRVKK